MFYRNHIKPIVFVLSIAIGFLMCSFTVVIADQHAEEAEESEATSDAEDF